MDSELATVIFMGLVLKIPVVGMLYLVWWACRSTPDPAAADGDDGHGFRRWRPSPKPPRRGPHGPATTSAGRRARQAETELALRGDARSWADGRGALARRKTGIEH